MVAAGNSPLVCNHCQKERDKPCLEQEIAHRRCLYASASADTVELAGFFVPDQVTERRLIELVHDIGERVVV